MGITDCQRIARGEARRSDATNESYGDGEGRGEVHGGGDDGERGGGDSQGAPLSR